MTETTTETPQTPQSSHSLNTPPKKHKEDPYKQFHMFFPKHINQGLNYMSDKRIKNALLDSFKDNSIKFIEKTYTEICMYYNLPHPRILPERPYNEEPKCIFEDIIMTITENDNNLKLNIISDLVDLKHIANGSYYQMENSIRRVSYNKYDVYRVKLEGDVYYFLNGIITKINGFFYLIGQLPTRPNISDENLPNECINEFNEILANINMSKISPKHKGTLLDLSEEDIEKLKEKYVNNNKILYDVFSIFHKNIFDESDTIVAGAKPKLIHHVVYRPFQGILQTTFGEMSDGDSIVFNSCGIFRKEVSGYKFSKLLLQGCRFSNTAKTTEVTGGAKDKFVKDDTKKKFRNRTSKKTSKIMFTDEEVRYMKEYLDKYTKYPEKTPDLVHEIYNVNYITKNLDNSFRAYQRLFTKVQSKIFSVYPVKKEDKTIFACNSFMDFILFLFSLVPSEKIHQVYLARCEGTRLYNNSLEILLENIINSYLSNTNLDILTMFSSLDDFYEYIRTIGTIFVEDF